MQLGRVVGQVVSTAKEKELTGFKLLLVADIPASDPLSADAHAHPLVAVDLVGAGLDEIVVVVTGSSARASPRTADVPTDSAVVAIVDIVTVGRATTYTKG